MTSGDAAARRSAAATSPAATSPSATSPSATSAAAAAAKVRAMLLGVRLSQSISVAASLGIPDALSGGARSAEDVAAQLDLHAPTVRRLLRVLAAAGLLHEGDGGTFELTELGEVLRRDVPGSVRDQAILFGRPYVLAAWGHFEHSVRTGENSFAALHGEDVWSWRAREPEEATAFNRAMASMSAPVGPALAAADSFEGAATVADIGGGNGTLLAAVLAAHPHLRGIVFDQPAVVAEAPPVLAAAGVVDRAETVGGDFFASVPPADVYLLKAILHDWSDADCQRILRTIRRAAKPTSRLLVVERVLGPANEDLEGKLMDLHMLVMPGGMERTRDEWSELLGAGGWRLREVTPLIAGWHRIEAVLD